MCGRFTQHLSWEELHRLADLIGQPRNLAPRYNIAPTTRIEVIRPAAGGNELARCAGGLCRLVEKAAQRASLDVQRPRRDGRRKADVPIGVQVAPLRHSGVGLLRVDGQAKGAKTPHYFSAPDGRPLAFAALWEHGAIPKATKG